MGKLVTTPTGSQVLDDLSIEASGFILEIMTRECRDLLEGLVDNKVLTVNEDGDAFTPEMLNEVVRQHFAMDNSGYGIPVNEWLPGITDELRVEIVDKVLASPEYTE